MRIDVVALVGKNGITLDDGQLVYDLVFPALSAGQVVELNFSGVTVFASPFFNAAIGRLLKDFNSDVLNRQLKVAALDAAGMEILRRVIENSRSYYADEKTRKAIDDILKEQAGDDELGN